MKKILALFLLVLTLAFAASAQDTCERHTYLAGYSFCAPAGWKDFSDKMSADTAVYAGGPVSGNFQANVSVSVAQGVATFKVFVDGNIKSMLDDPAGMGATSIKLVRRSEFTTDAKDKGEKVEFDTVANKMNFATFQYFFEKGNFKFAIVGTALESEKAANEKLFDAVAKSFRITK
jgi:hypothetical protein